MKIPELRRGAAATLSEQIADWLRMRIEAGEFEPEIDPLPSEGTIAETFDVSKDTARAAIRILRDEGLIFTRPQRGSYVPRRQPRRPARGALIVITNAGHISTGPLLAALTDVDDSGTPLAHAVHVRPAYTVLAVACVAIRWLAGRYMLVRPCQWPRVRRRPRPRIFDIATDVTLSDAVPRATTGPPVRDSYGMILQDHGSP